MQSSETSGASADEIGAGNGRNFWRVRHHGKTAPRSRRNKTTSVTMSVAGTAFIAATLFVAYDVYSTLAEVKRELALMGTAVAARVATVAPETAEATLAGSLGDYPGIVSASFIQGGVPEQRPLFSELVPAGEHGLLSIEGEQSGALAGIAGRGAAALALAGLMTAFTLRRRRDDDTEVDLQLETLEVLTAAIPMGAACWTEEGRMIVCNEDYRARLKLRDNDITYSEALGRLLTGGYLKLLREDRGNRLLELHQVDGSCLMIEERPLDNGGFMTLVSDETKRRRADVLLTTIREEQRQLARRYHEEKIKAEAASRAKTNFLAHLSHDIRTPLNHIIGFAELMGRETYGKLGDPRYADYVQSIRNSGEHLLNSFSAILDLAELDNGQKVLRSDKVPVDEVIDSVSRRFQAQIKRAGLELAVSANCGAVLNGDRLALVRMVANIVENAIRFTPPGGELTLATFAAEDGVVIEVTDTGIGMNEERLSSLGQPFALGDATFTKEGVGPGLGISISRAIAELSGGRMVIDSTPAIGTTVAISLPIGADLSKATVAA
ncbi:HAMP domain-containing histidine kinase [Devosia sp. BK]|uniref:sensor histidine kinase n=1 Tax=Devosia sp. BK TaxID=2871706 RepID=UPI00293AF021|nr:HAMP domain-containing sensor histidine kinase [Devosia sp. BK]MDV3251526.1 HAMP domain-containing histidine kinase [Devosia sp. BK]